jgi:hypothetical protein
MCKCNWAGANFNPPQQFTRGGQLLVGWVLALARAAASLRLRLAAQQGFALASVLPNESKRMTLHPLARRVGPGHWRMAQGSQMLQPFCLQGDGALGSGAAALAV